MLCSLTRRPQLEVQARAALRQAHDGIRAAELARHARRDGAAVHPRHHIGIVELQQRLEVAKP